MVLSPEAAAKLIGTNQGTSIGLNFATTPVAGGTTTLANCADNTESLTAAPTK